MVDAKPKFLTCKYRLSGLIRVFDYQLRYHFLNLNNLYVTACSCATHRHNKRPCKIVDTLTCPKCKTPTNLLLTFETLLAHGLDFASKEIYTCCPHVHSPPCGRCLYCNTVPSGKGAINQYPCVIKSSFECVYTSSVVCPKHKGAFTESLDLTNVAVQEHIYNTNHLMFYFCKTHAHRHTTHPTELCYISAFACCEDAVRVSDYDSSFAVVTTEKRSGRGSGSDKLKLVEYILYDPRIWLDASFNHFVSFIRAVISMPAVAKTRYERFEASNFSVSSVKKYKSGKESMARLAVTGFDTNGIYQTSTISCQLPLDTVSIPQALYDLLESQNYDLSLVCIKRDPSIKSTCMFVCKVIRNEDPYCETIAIPDAISKPMNQDQVSVRPYPPRSLSLCLVRASCSVFSAGRGQECDISAAQDTGRIRFHAILRLQIGEIRDGSSVSQDAHVDRQSEVSAVGDESAAHKPQSREIRGSGVRQTHSN